MTEQSKENLNYIVSEVGKLIEEKYTRGDREHSGDLMDMPTEQLIEEAIMENIDQIVYLMTLRRKLTQEIEITGDIVPDDTLGNKIVFRK